MGGGAATGLAYSGGNPLGAIIGGAIGSTIAGWKRGPGSKIGFFEMGMSPELFLLRMLFKAATEKAREKVKATYGVDISDKGILQQIVDMTKQTYGGNLDMAIRSAQVRELVELYAMTTGQNTRGMPAKMTPSTLVQSGGILSQGANYSNGIALPPLGGLPGAGLGARPVAIHVTSEITLSAPETKAFLETGVLKKIVDSPRVVHSAVITAQRGNSGRRESLALALSPGTLTS
jgi:hypothetical protein